MFKNKKNITIIASVIGSFFLLTVGYISGYMIGINKNQMTINSIENNSARASLPNSNNNGINRRFNGMMDLSQICNNPPNIRNSQIQQKIDEVCADGTVTPQEQQELKQLFQQIRPQRNFMNQNNNSNSGIY